MTNMLSAWADRQMRQSWWLLPLQPVVVLAMLAAGITTVWPSTDWTSFHHRLGVLTVHGWMVLSIVAPLMTLVSYWLILRGGKTKVFGLWIRLGGDTGIAISLSVFTLLHQTDTGNEEDAYSTVIFCGLLVAALLIIARDITEIILTERIAVGIHQDRNGRNS